VTDERSRLLVVDDDELERLAMRRALDRAGAKVELVEAADGVTAVRRAGEGFDCILLDLRLPARDGLEVVREVRAAGVHTPIVIMTASADEVVAVELMKSGATDFVVKRSLDEQALWSRLQQAMRVGRAEAALRKQQEQLRATAAFEHEMLGIVTHDLRNPIAAIAMNGDWLVKRDLAPDVQKAVKRINASVERAQRMLRDLVDFANTRAEGGLVIERDDCDLHEIVRGVIEHARAANPERAIEHQVIGDGKINADAERIGQIADNLIANALGHGASSGPVEVITRGTERGVELEVHNTGEPIPPKVLESMFSAFERAERHKVGRRSIGIGLYLVRQIAAAHGGTVAASSSAGDGTTFRVLLPR
jgi:signal transduction histidine kinase